MIAAEEDKSLGPEVQRRLTMPRLAEGSLKVVPKSGHLVPMEASDKLVELLCDFAGGGPRLYS